MQEVDEKIGIGVVSGAETLTKGGSKTTYFGRKKYS